MTTIRTIGQTHLTPEQVLFAARDFSARRVEVFPAVRAEHFAVHSEDATGADVTEGTPALIGINWERCGYDWSQPDRVVATVTDSNVYRVPGSAWELIASPTDSGSVIEMNWIRVFKRTPRGLFWATLFRLVGQPLFRGYARTVLKNIEQLESTTKTR